MKKLLLLMMLPAVIPSYAQKWTKNYDFVDPCICGLSLAGKDQKIGYVDIDGNIKIPIIYDEGLAFSEGYTAVRKGTSWIYFDSTGKQIIDEVFADAQNFHNGLAAVMKNDLYGYIDLGGKTVIDFQFFNARAFSDGWAPVSNSKGLWGYIDRKGNFVLKPQYDFADSFSNGEARVIKDSKVLYIDKTNKVLHE